MPRTELVRVSSCALGAGQDRLSHGVKRILKMGRTAQATHQIDQLRVVPSSSSDYKSDTMKTTIFLLPLAICTVVSLSGCAPSGAKSETVAQGTIFSVSYQDEAGHISGLTRFNDSKAVPGGNGAWNIDAHGRLTRDFLVITRPQRKDLGPLIIPVHRLLNVQFGDGGIKQVTESQPKP